MAAIPEPQITIAGLIDAAHEAEQEPPRPHMGASQLGHHCDRYLWLSFRWMVQDKISGRVLRLFRRGHKEEESIVSDLRRIGIEVHNTGAHQSRVDFGCHVSGSIDGIIKRGVPEAPAKPHVLECKTHNAKSFADLARNGVEKSKPMHWAQMQAYMLGTGVDRALYYAVCKDDDSIYTERVRLDKGAAERIIERGKRIVQSNRIPPRYSDDPSFYSCKWCPAHAMCFQQAPTKHANCRTCAHSTALPDSTWRCEFHKADGIPVDFQRIGCDDHLIHPDAVPWGASAGPEENTITFIIDGRPVINGSPDANAFASREILANPALCANGDEFTDALRARFDARISG